MTTSIDEEYEIEARFVGHGERPFQLRLYKSLEDKMTATGKPALTFKLSIPSFQSLIVEMEDVWDEHMRFRSREEEIDQTMEGLS